MGGSHTHQPQRRIVLGELSAFSVMADVNATYNEDFDGFRLTGFDRTPTTI